MKIEESLTKRILAAFENEPRINMHRSPIRVELDEDVAIVEGEVENVAAKKIALELAAGMPGVTGIVDRLRVAPSRRMTDAEIRVHLRDAWLQEPAFREISLTVQSGGHTEKVREIPERPSGSLDGTVEDGIITLNGQLPSLSHKRLAGLLAWWIPGARDVVNGVEVVPDQIDDDDEISDAVRMALEKDRFVDATEISVHTRDRVVTLDGTLPNDELREMAEMDAWFVFGVDRVVNRLEVSAPPSGP